MSLDRPRFRRDLEATPIEVGGQGYVEVRDPTTGGSFRFYDFEYRVALAFDGLAFEQVIPWLRLVAGLECQIAELREFATRLHDMGFLESSPTGVALAPLSVPADASAPEPAGLGDSGLPIDQAAASQPTADEHVAAPMPRAPADVELSPAGSTDKAKPSPDETVAETSPPPALATEEGAPAGPPLSPPAAPVVEPASDEITAPAAAVAEQPAPPTEEGLEVDGGEVAGASADGAEPALPPSHEPASAATFDGYAPAVADGITTPAPRSAKTVNGFATATGELPDEDAAWVERAVEVSAPARVATSMAVVGPSGETAEAVAPGEGFAEAVVPTLTEVEAVASAEGTGEAAASPTPPAPPAPEVEAAAPAELSEKTAAPVPPEVEAAAPAELSEIAAAPVPPEVEAAAPAEGFGEAGASPLPEVEAAAPAEGFGEAATPTVEASEPAALAPEEAGKEAAPTPTDSGEDAAPTGAYDESAAPPGLRPEGTESTPERTVEEATSTEAIPADGVSRPEEAAEELAMPAPAEDRPRPEGWQLDSSAFPVLPTPPPQPVSPMPPRSRTPPVRPLPPSYLTPPPSTLGPLRTAQEAAERKHQRRSLLLFGSLGVLAAVAVLAVSGPFFFPGGSTPRADVRTLSATPGSVLRYFGRSGLITALPGAVLKFPAGGMVTRIAKAGSVVAVGDVLAAVEAARPLLAQLAHQRERLAFYQQIAETMRQLGNTAEEEKSSANVEVRKAKIAKILGALGQVAVVADTAGEVEEAYIREGETVETGALALRMRSPGHRATFELPRREVAEARRLGFCQVSVDGFVLPCKHAPEQGDETHATVDLAALPPQLLGRPARLARARYGGAVALPASAVQTAGRRQQVLVVSSFGRLEARPVTVAEQNAAEAVVVQGLDAGENVVLEPTSDLRPGMQVTARP